MKKNKKKLTHLKTSLNYEVYVRKDPRYSLGWHIKPVFAIGLHNNDVSLLENISTCLRYHIRALHIKFTFFLVETYKPNNKFNVDGLKLH